jgi:hypothetical protein
MDEQTRDEPGEQLRAAVQRSLDWQDNSPSLADEC